MTIQDQPRAGEAELLPCPFCGAPREELGLTVHPNPPPADGKAEWGVQCYCCHVETPFYDTQAEAVSAWNRRAALSASTAQAEELSDEQIGGMCDIGWIGGASITRKQGFIAGYHAALSAHPRGDAGAWRPISGLRHSKPVLVIGQYPTRTGWSDVYQCWRDGDVWARWPHSSFSPTHWMPLAAPPTRAEM